MSSILADAPPYLLDSFVHWNLTCRHNRSLPHCLSTWLHSCRASQHTDRRLNRWQIFKKIYSSVFGCLFEPDTYQCRLTRRCPKDKIISLKQVFFCSNHREAFRKDLTPNAVTSDSPCGKCPGKIFWPRHMCTPSPCRPAPGLMLQQPSFDGRSVRWPAASPKTLRDM